MPATPTSVIRVTQLPSAVERDRGFLGDGQIARARGDDRRPFPSRAAAARCPGRYAVRAERVELDAWKRRAQQLGGVRRDARDQHAVAARRDARRRSRRSAPASSRRRR